MVVTLRLYLSVTLGNAYVALPVAVDVVTLVTPRSVTAATALVAVVTLRSSITGGRGRGNAT